MADEFNSNSSTNWWDSPRNRFDTASNPSSSSGLNALTTFSWPTEMVHVKSRSSLDESASVSETSVLQAAHDSGADLHLMGLGLSSQSMDWNQSLFRGGGGGEKSDGSFRSMLQENLNSNTNYQQESGIGSSQVQWRERVLGFSLDQQQFSPHGSSSDSTVTCQGMQTSFQMDTPPAMYGSPSTLLQGLILAPDNQSQQASYENRSMNYPYGGNYGISGNDLLPSSWSKVPQFLRNSPPKQSPHGQLHFSNNAPFWNASASAMNDVRPTYFQPLTPQFPASNFEEKPKNMSEGRDSGTVAKKSGNEAASTVKRPRNETPSPLPAFKVRKEKMGDRITALQQLVSPFGKTDTASVLSEAIEYIKFLHEQVTVLSTPYMKSGAPIHHHQSNSDKSKDPEGQKQDLRSRGLCLVPVSSTFPVTHETTMDIWTPTYGGTFR